MDRVLRFNRMAERAERLAQERLQVHLARVDHVVDAPRVSERRRSRIALTGRGRPQLASVRGVGFGSVRSRRTRRVEPAIAKVEAEETELPELVRQILADVGDDPVRADDHLLARLVVVGAGNVAGRSKLGPYDVVGRSKLRPYGFGGEGLGCGAYSAPAL